MKKMLMIVSLTCMSALAMASVVTESGEKVVNGFNEVWATPDSE